MAMRVLAAKRISRDTEASSALQRQDRDLRAAVIDGEHDLVDMVEDSCVSGAVNLDERPSLGEWLREPKMYEWDALMVTTQDRISRDDMHWWKFVGWVLDNDKTVIVLDDPSLDLTTEDGRMIAGIKATQAAKYRKAVQEKRLKQAAYYREMDLWPGGTWPYGYRAERFTVDGKDRWHLVIDPETSAMVREAYVRIAEEGWSLLGLATDWNKRGVRTSKDHQRYINAKNNREGSVREVRGSLWSVTVLKSVLKRPSMMGYAMHAGKIRRRNGKPIQWADPILSVEEFDRLQTAIKERARGRAGVKNTRSPVSGVVLCRCGARLYANHNRGRASGKKYKGYYVCATWGQAVETCDYRSSWPIDVVHEHVEAGFLETVGDLEFFKLEYIPGRDNTAKIAELKTAIKNQAEALTLVTGSEAVRAISESLEEYSAELAALEAAPVVASRWEKIPTGKTYRQLWDGCADWQEKGQLLRDSGLTVSFAGTWRSPDIRFVWPEDLRARLNLTAEPGAIDVIEAQRRERRGA